MFSFEIGSLCNLTKKKKQNKTKGKRFERDSRERAPQVLPRRATVAITYSGQQPKNPRPDPATIIIVKEKKLLQMSAGNLSLPFSVLHFGCLAEWRLRKKKRTWNIQLYSLHLCFLILRLKKNGNLRAQYSIF